MEKRHLPFACFKRRFEMLGSICRPVKTTGRLLQLSHTVLAVKYSFATLVLPLYDGPYQSLSYIFTMLQSILNTLTVLHILAY